MAASPFETFKTPSWPFVVNFPLFPTYDNYLPVSVATASSFPFFFLPLQERLLNEILQYIKSDSSHRATHLRFTHAITCNNNSTFLFVA